MSNGRKLLVGIAAVVLVAGGVVWAVMTGGHAKESSSVDDGRVRVEIRAMPVMKLYRNGKELGTTPFSFIVPSSKTPFEMEARWTENRMAVTGASKVFRLKKVFKVVPDRSQTIDLDRKDAEPITEE
jgi:hypothetical protein